AIVRLSGAGAFDIAAQCVTPWPLAPRAATLVTVRNPHTRIAADRALATTFPAPRSFTGEHVVEISTHGGAVAPALVVAAFVAAGARPALAGEFTRRALLHGKLDLIQAEALGDLIDAPSQFAHAAALTQLSGALTTRVTALRESILELEALLAYDIDFPDEDDGPIAPARIATAATAARDDIALLLETLPAARIGREGAVVVLAGVPNAGKSSLFNALIGEARAIVTEHAGTTRDAIDALIEADPYPLRLVDTAGLRRASDPVERLGVEVSERWLARADIALACGTTSSDRETAAAASRERSAATVLRVRTMADVNGGDADNADASVSAVSGAGLTDLRQAIARALETRYPRPRTDVPLITRTRHAASLETARTELTAFLDAWQHGAVPATIAAVHVRTAVNALDALIGAVSTDDVLARVFERFCVGK
ncbi:MAG TPA: tRNA modification GTPase, partial [Gemmatimonadaceae bacterium]|nr:tRNA modification GTPase [Gemmatimonadaceae bacterium]